MYIQFPNIFTEMGSTAKLVDTENFSPLCSSCFRMFFSLFRFERPGRNPVVTEHVQPSPTTNSALNDSLGMRNPGSYQSIANSGQHAHRVSVDIQFILWLFGFRKRNTCNEVVIFFVAP